MLKFWATNLVKLTGSQGDSFVSSCFSDLVAVLLQGHRLMATQRSARHCLLGPRRGFLADLIHVIMKPHMRNALFQLALPVGRLGASGPGRAGPGGHGGDGLWEAGQRHADLPRGGLQ